MNNIGFLTISDYIPSVYTDYHWWHRRKLTRPYTKEEIKEKYLEYAVFFLSYCGTRNGQILEKVEDWDQDPIESPKFLEKVEGKFLATCIFTVSRSTERWETDIPNVQNNGLYRVLYNDGDDSYMHVFFATEEEALNCFKFIIELNFNYNELNDVLYELGFWGW